MIVAVQIIALGGGGFSMEPDNLVLDRYILAQARGRRVCFLGQASAESQDYLVRFYRAFNQLDARASHLSLFTPHTADIAAFLSEQDVIYVGGGNTRSMLALWREWEIDHALRAAAEAGTVLCGISAGANCWFDYATTDSVPGALRPIQCLGFLRGSVSPHYDGEPQRRPTFHQLIADGVIPAGIGYDDGAAGHYIDGQLTAVVSSRPAARAYRVERDDDGQAHETPLPTRYLG